MATWYVDGSVSTSGNGTSWASAWKNVTNITGVKPGDVVYISGGPTGSSLTYNIPGTWALPSGSSATNRITYQIGQDPSHNGTAIFNNTGGGVWISGPSNIVVSGDAGDGQMHFKLSGYGQVVNLPSGQVNVHLSYIDFGNCGSANWRVIDMRGVNGIEIDHIYANVTNATADAFSFASFAGTTWDQNLFHDNTLILPGDGNGKGADGLQWVGIGFSIYNNTITGSVAPYSGGQHQDGWQSTGGDSYIKIYGNTFTNIGNYPIFGDGYFGGFNHLWIYNNIVTLNTTGLQNSNPPQGIAVGVDGGAQNGYVFNDIIIANNTIVDYANHIGIALGNVTSHSASFTNNYVENNVFVNSGGVETYGTSVTMSNNVSLSSAAASGMFMHYALNDRNNDLHLTSLAVSLINKGANLSSDFTADKDGTSRPQGSAWDIGAYEYISGGTTVDTTPPVLTSVSPTDNSTGVAANSNIVLTFSETVVPGSGNIVIRNSNGTVAQSIAVTDTSQVSFSGNQVTINPSSDLAAGSGYYVNIASGVIRDVAGNNYAGISNSTSFNFTTDAPVDTTPPVLTSVSPTDNSTGVAANSNIVLTFSETVVPGSGNIVIRNSNGTVAQSIAVTDTSQVSFSGNQVTINPSSDLAAGSGYYVNIASGVIRDVAGNNYAGISNSTSFNFTTDAPVDTTPPVLTSVSPTDNSTGVAANSNIVLTFSETVVPGSGNIVIRNSNGTVAQSIAVTDTSQVSFSGNQVTINPSSDLAAGSGYYVNIASGVIRDVAGNNYAGISNSTSFNFTTAAPGGTPTNLVVNGDFETSDFTGWALSGNVGPGLYGPQTYINSTAESGQYAAGLGPMGSDGTLGQDIQTTAGQHYTLSFWLANAGGAPNDFTAKWNGQTLLALVNNSAQGYTEYTYDVVGTAGTSHLEFDFRQDPSHWNLDGISVTAAVDTTPPVLTSVSPTDNSTGVAANSNIVLTFSETVVPGSGNIVIRNSNGTVAQSIAVTDTSQVSFSGNQVTINPSSDLAAGSGYYVNIASGVIRDVAGNNYAGISNSTSFNFTTDAPVDTTPPVLTSVSPTDNSTGVAANSNIVLTFSETVVPGSGNIVIRNSNGTVAQSIAVTDTSQVSFSGNQVTINPSSDLAAGSGYYVNIASGVIRDVAGNNYAGISNSTSFNFTTAAPGGTPTNLVVNGDFETSDFTGWALSGNVGPGLYGPQTYINSTAESGQYAAGLGPMGSDGTLGQDIQTTAGQHYTLSFWLANAGGAPNDFTAKWNGQTLLALVNNSAQGYTEYTYDVVGTAGTSHLEFDFRQDPSHWNLDGISVTAAVDTTPPVLTSVSPTDNSTGVAAETVAPAAPVIATETINGNSSVSLAGTAEGNSTVRDGTHTANTALLIQYMAGSFVMPADGFGGTLIGDPSPTTLTQTLTHPRHA